MIGTDLATERSEGLPKANLRNLRTEIVLKDGNDVAFWFSYYFPIATLQQPKTGKRGPFAVHQTEVPPSTLFPKKRGFGEKISFGDDEQIN